MTGVETVPPSPAPWTSSARYRVLNGCGWFTYYDHLFHANEDARESGHPIEESTRYALDPVSGRPTVDGVVEYREVCSPTAGNIYAAELNGPGGAGTELP